jgi:hypothetical protein
MVFDMEDMRKVAEKVVLYRPIIDGNIVNGGVNIRPKISVSSFLYDPTPDKLAAVDNLFTKGAIDGLDAASYFLSATRPYVLSEVIVEVNAFAAHLSRHYLNYTRNLRDARGSWKDTNGKHAIGLENLERLAERANSFVDELKKHEQIVYWDSVNAARTLLGFSRSASQDLVERTREEHRRKNLPQGVGITLETDQKLAAFCFLAARNENVVLVTKDHGVIALANRIRTKVFGHEKKRWGLSTPVHKIATYDLNDGLQREIYIPSATK